MRSKRGILTWAVVLLTMLAATAPAIAKPNKDPIPGGTCEGNWPNSDTWNAKEGPYTVTLDRSNGPICLDFSSTHAAQYLVTVTDSDSAKALYAKVRDSHPGDYCTEVELHRLRLNRSTTGEMTVPESGLIPASKLDACGTVFSDSDPRLTFLLIPDFGTSADGYIDVEIVRLGS